MWCSECGRARAGGLCSQSLSCGAVDGSRYRLKTNGRRLPRERTSIVSLGRLLNIGNSSLIVCASSPDVQRLLATCSRSGVVCSNLSQPNILVWHFVKYEEGVALKVWHIARRELLCCMRCFMVLCRCRGLV